MLSIILTSRVKDNRDSNIKNFLDSLISCGATKENCEILIKYDNDDDARPSEDFFNSYPITIKRFVWSRGEGRHGLHLDHFYLFAQHDSRTKFVLIAADDFTFIRQGFIDNILGVNNEFAFVGPNRPRLELYKNNWKDKNCMRVWKDNEGPRLPCFSVRILEVLQNFGWQCNADNWQTLIAIILFEDYNLDIWHHIDAFHVRNPTDGKSGYGCSFNNMEIDGNRDPENLYYFELVKQQAKNIFLNIRFRRFEKACIPMN